MSPVVYPKGFTLPPSSAPISVSFASPLSFLPAQPPASSSPSTSLPAGGPGGLGDLPKELFVRYWDDTAGVDCVWSAEWKEGDKKEVDLTNFLKAVEGVPGLLVGAGGAAEDKEREDKGKLKRLEKDAMVPIAIKLGAGKGKQAITEKRESCSLARSPFCPSRR